MIRSLLQTVASTWKWTKDRYPNLDLSDRSKRRHVLAHLTKALGGLAGEEEHVDHGLPMNREEYRTLIAKVMIAAAQLADVENIDPDVLDAEIGRILKESNR